MAMAQRTPSKPAFFLRSLSARRETDLVSRGSAWAQWPLSASSSPRLADGGGIRRRRFLGRVRGKRGNGKQAPVAPKAREMIRLFMILARFQS